MRELRYASRCRDCGAHLDAGTPARLARHHGRWVAFGHPVCGDAAPSPAPGDPHPADPGNVPAAIAALRPHLTAAAYHDVLVAWALSTDPCALADGATPTHTAALALAAALAPPTATEQQI